MLADIPIPAPGGIEGWLLSAAAVGYIVLIGKKLFVRKPPIEVEFVMRGEFMAHKAEVKEQITRLETKLDTSFITLGSKLDEMKGELLASGERRGEGIHKRINALETNLARVDERTKQQRAEL